MRPAAIDTSSACIFGQMWYTPSAPSKAEAKLRGRPKSTTRAATAPRANACSTCSGRRTQATHGKPRCFKADKTAWPVLPPAPVTRIFAESLNRAPVPVLLVSTAPLKAQPSGGICGTRTIRSSSNPCSLRRAKTWSQSRSFIVFSRAMIQA